MAAIFSCFSGFSQFLKKNSLFLSKSIIRLISHLLFCECFSIRKIADKSNRKLKYFKGSVFVEFAKSCSICARVVYVATCQKLANFLFFFGREIEEAGWLRKCCCKYSTEVSRFVLEILEKSKFIASVTP